MPTSGGRTSISTSTPGSSRRLTAATRKHGTIVRLCAIDEKPLAAVEAWLAEQRALWEGRTNRLEQFVATVHPEETPE